MPDTAPNTEEHLKECARKVFMHKGFDGTTSRDIAEASGLNVALTNYYFRSKEQLFRMIFADAHRLFFQEIDEILNRSIEIREKIPLFIEASFALFFRHPNLPFFLLSEMHRHPELLTNADNQHDPPAIRAFRQQLSEAIERGEMRPVAPIQVLQLLLANTQFLFLSRPLLADVSALSAEAYHALAVCHQRTVTDMIMSYLFAF